MISFDEVVPVCVSRDALLGLRRGTFFPCPQTNVLQCQQITTLDIGSAIVNAFPARLANSNPEFGMEGRPSRLPEAATDTYSPVCFFGDLCSQKEKFLEVEASINRMKRTVKEDPGGMTRRLPLRCASAFTGHAAPSQGVW